MEVRRFRRDEGLLFRGIRLRALQDAPEAFAGTYEDSVARPPEFWDDWIAKWAEGERQIGFVALEGTLALGVVGAYFDAERGEPDVVHLIAMWVAPEARRHGVGAALTGAVVAWARTRRARLVKLWVTTTNAPARRLYERAGFRPTGALDALPGRGLRVERMEREP